MAAGAGSTVILRELKADRVLTVWQSQLVTRSSRYLTARHGALHRRRYESALARPAGPSAGESARRGRILHLLGRAAESRRAFDEALRRDELCAEAWAWRWCAEASFSGGPFSFSGVDRAIEIEPGRPLWRAMRGIGRMVEMLGVRRMDVRGPMADLESALAGDPSCQPALIAAGMTLWEANRPERAAGFFDRALREDPRTAFLHMYRGSCRRALGDMDGFVADMESAVYEDEGIGYFSRALDSDSTITAQKIEEATRFIARHPNAYWMYVYRGDYRRAPEVSDYLGGLRDLEAAVELNPECAYAWAYLSRARLSHGSAAAAMEAADRSVLLNPACGWIFIWRGEVRRRLGDAKGALADFDRGLKLDPDYELGYAWRGGAKRSLGRPEDALPDLAMATALDPRYAWAMQEHSLALRRLGRTSEALERLQAAHRLDPKFVWCGRPDQSVSALSELDEEIRRRPRNALARAWRGQTRLQNADYSGAKADLDRALALDPGLGWAWSWRGQALAELGRRRTALRDFNEGLRLEPLDAHAYAWRGKVRHQEGDSKGALEDLGRAVELNRKSSWIFLWKGEVEQSLGLLKEAAADFDFSLGIDRKHVTAYLARAALRSTLGDAVGARGDLERAREIAPLDPRVRCRLGALDEGDGRWDEARANYASALTGAGELEAAERRAARRFLKDGPIATPGAIAKALARGRLLAEAGRHAETAVLCGEILRADENNSEALALRAEASRCAGDYGKHVADLDRLLRLAPERPDAWIRRGAGRRNFSDFTGALSDAEEALRRGPAEPASALQLKSEALRGLGRFQESIDAATRAIAARADDDWSYVVRGKARRQSGDVDGALADFRRAAALAPDSAKALGWEADALRKAGRLDEAAAAAAAALRLLPDCAWIAGLGGEIARERGDARGGLELIRRAVALDANASCAFDFVGADTEPVRSDSCYAWIYAWRGGISRKRNQWEAARRDLEHAVELDPSCFWARAWLGELKLAVGEAAGALPDLAAALAAYPGYAEAWTWQGRAHAELGRWKTALASYKKSSTLDAGDPWALIGAALCLDKLARKSEAEKCLGRAAALAPALFEAKGGVAS